MSLPNPYVEALTPGVMVCGDGAFGGLLGPEGGALVSGTSVLVKETPKNFLTLPTM